MKGMFDNGKLINIVPDNYKAGNPIYDDTMQAIDSIGFKLEENESVMGSAINEYGTAKYYIEKGVLKKYTEAELKATPEYIAHIDRLRQAEYLKQTDGEFFKLMALKHKDDPDAKTWIDKRNAIKDSIK